MLHALAARRPGRAVWWLHGARSGRDHSFAAETRDLLASLPHARGRVYYSRPGPGDVRGQDYDEAGRLTRAVLAELDLQPGAEAYVCGPARFMEEIAAGLVALGHDPSRVHTEPFGPAPGSAPGVRGAPARRPHPPAGPPGDGPVVEFARSGLAVAWGAGFTSLLELAEACDVPVRWSCRTGVCHSCETALIAGTVGYSPDPVEPAAPGRALICCAQPRDALVLDL